MVPATGTSGERPHGNGSAKNRVGTRLAEGLRPIVVRPDCANGIRCVGKRLLRHTAPAERASGRSSTAAACATRANSRRVKAQRRGSARSLHRRKFSPGNFRMVPSCALRLSGRVADKSPRSSFFKDIPASRECRGRRSRNCTRTNFQRIPSMDALPISKPPTATSAGSNFASTKMSPADVPVALAAAESHSGTVRRVTFDRCGGNAFSSTSPSNFRTTHRKQASFCSRWKTT